MTRPHKSTMWAVMRDGEPYTILPDLEMAETHLGSLSLNGFSKHKWTLQKVTVTFPHETANERRRRLNRHVQAVVELNQTLRDQGKLG